MRLASSYMAEREKAQTTPECMLRLSGQSLQVKKRGWGGEGRGGKKYMLVILSSKDWAATGLMFYK